MENTSDTSPVPAHVAAALEAAGDMSSSSSSSSAPESSTSAGVHASELEGGASAAGVPEGAAPSDSAAAAGEQLEPEPSPLELKLARLAQRVITLGLVLERVAAAVVKVHDAQHGTHTSTIHGDVAELRAFLGECEAARAEAAAADGGA